MLYYPRRGWIRVSKFPMSLGTAQRQSPHPPANPTHQPKRHLNQLRQLITLPRRDLLKAALRYRIIIRLLLLQASNTWRQHSPPPIPNPAEYQYSPNTTYPASLPQSAPHWPLLCHKSLRS